MLTETQNQKKEHALQLIWNTFIPHPIPDIFFAWDDDNRYEYIENNAYPIYENISAMDLDKNISSMIHAVIDI